MRGPGPGSGSSQPRPVDPLLPHQLEEPLDRLLVSDGKSGHTTTRSGFFHTALVFQAFKGSWRCLANIKEEKPQKDSEDQLCSAAPGCSCTLKLQP